MTRRPRVRAADTSAVRRRPRGRLCRCGFAGWAQVVTLLLALAFGRASVAPPCEAHLDVGSPALHAGVTPATHHGAAPADGHEETGAPHGGSCTCLDDCHGTASAAWVAAAPVHLLPDAPRAARSTPAPRRQSVARTNLPHVLPFATAPPTTEL